MSQKRHKKSTEIGFYIFACYFYRINDEYVLKYADIYDTKKIQFEVYYIYCKEKNYGIGWKV